MHQLLLILLCASCVVCRPTPPPSGMEEGKDGTVQLKDQDLVRHRRSYFEELKEHFTEIPRSVIYGLPVVIIVVAMLCICNLCTEPPDKFIYV